MDRPLWAPTEVDITRPSVARVYDYYLGGSHNFESDRAFGRRVVDVYPALPIVLRENRAFLRRVVRHLVGAGVEQFLDLGSGIPTVGNVHEVAHAVNPAARVVYVDHDPVAVAHSRRAPGRRRRAPRSSPPTCATRTRPRPRRAVGGLLDLRRPVAVLARRGAALRPGRASVPAEVMAQLPARRSRPAATSSSVTRRPGRRAEAAAGQRLYPANGPRTPMHPAHGARR